MSNRGTEQGNKLQFEVGDASGSNNVVCHGSLDVRSEWGIGKVIHGPVLTDDDDDFVTPDEHFGKSKTVKLQGTGVKTKKPKFVGLANEEAEKQGKKKEQRIKGNMHCDGKTYVDKGIGRIGKQAADVDGRKIVISKAAMKASDEGNEATPSKIEKPKKVRSYEGYLQKKISPSIMTIIIKNLTEEHAKWVRSTGFGELLNFEMQVHAHKLGYNLVQAFDVENCALVLNCGTIVINERLVHRVIGLPMGEMVLTTTDTDSLLDVWGGQFSGKTGCEIPAGTVRDRLIESICVDRLFKLNFLVMVYNFFIEGHQNHHVNRDVLKLELNVDACAQYNWCRLLIDKLRSSYAYWSAEKKQSFTGSLPFLTYLYLSKVRNHKYVHVPPVFPAFKGWTDLLIKERQKIELAEGSFGVGEIVHLPGEEEEVADRVDNSGERDMTHDDQVIEDTEDLEQNGDDDSCAANEMDLIQDYNDLQTEANSMNDLTKSLTNGGSVQRDSQLAAEVCNTGLEEDSNKQAEFGVPNHMAAVFAVTNNTITPNMCVDKTSPLVMESVLAKQGNQTENNSSLLTAEQYMRSFYKLDTLEANNMGTKWTSSADKNAVLLGCGSKSEDQVVQGTQGAIEDAIDKHFQDDKYMAEFRKNLNVFKGAYDKCVTNCEVALALYSSHAELATLREEHRPFFKLFEETSPLSKSLVGGPLKERNKTAEGQVDDSSFVLSFSLGFSQVTPKKLGDTMDGLQDPGEESEVVANQLVQRPRKGARATEICRSPYVSRVVDISGYKITNEEKYVWEWLFENRRNRGENLFESHKIMCTKKHFQSLQTNSMVERRVIDAWSYLLNANEALRANTSPFRLFLTSETAYGPMNLEVDPTDRLSTMERNAIFSDNVEAVMETMYHLHNRIYDVKDFEMFIFPIYDSSHHYIISFNIKKPRWEIIDNRVPNGDFEQSFGNLPYRLDNQKSLLNKLRVVYEHKMLTWDQNSKRDYMVRGATYLAKGKKVAD
ncbi:hypothetical protein DCAR_0311477 [Daucus carota subsp. sativus]|uniref:Uncharacterized protein n=1 Tax=Daucus carota subsp. sativus TaxID=79200 RepID=A0A166AKJ9_DAUCS|nr:hypothetical protein DCAR_0311477 [Daucus carota subsp. sativus]